MFSNNRRKKDDIELEKNTRNLKSELLYLKKRRKQNNNEIFYNKEFIETVKEKPTLNFSMISTASVVNVTEEYLKNKYSQKSNISIRMVNRTQNYDIEDNFCLKFKKSNSEQNQLNNVNIDNDIRGNKDHYINFNSESEDSDNESEDEQINPKDFEDDNNILIPSTIKRYLPVKYQEKIPKSNKTFDTKLLKKYLQEGNIINNYEYVCDNNIENKVIIPLVCYTTWHTKNIPPLMKHNYETLQSNNPEITFKLFDEKDCVEFIQNNFPDEVMYAYKCLSPSSYKSDLWRYCILLINGGIYLDIKYNTINNFKLKDFCYKEHFAFDHCGKSLDYIWNENSFGVYTSIIVVKPNNPVLQECINKVVQNVENLNYGKNALYPTGPGLLGEKYFEVKYDEEMNFIKDVKLFHHEESNAIIYNNTPVLDIYNMYREEQFEYQNNLHYSELWKRNSIYNMEYNILQKKIINIKESNLPSVVCIVHIGSYHIFMKMKEYINNLIKAKYDEYNLDIYFNIINTIRSEHISDIKKLYPDENYIISENYGFDIGSFFHILQIIKTYNEKYDYVIKIHTKTNHIFRDELINPILGDINKIRKIVEMFQDNKKIGIIASKKSRCIDAQVDFLRNKNYLQQFLYWYFNETTNVIKQVYSTGTIFWTRFDLFKNTFLKYNIPNIYNSFNSIYTFDFNWYYFANKKYLENIPQEREKLYKHYNENKTKLNISGNLFHSLKYRTNSEPLRDGMIEHAYERLFGYINHRLGYKFKFMD